MPAHEQRKDEQFADSDQDEALDEKTQSVVQPERQSSDSDINGANLSTSRVFSASPYQPVGSTSVNAKNHANLAGASFQQDFEGGGKKYVAYTVKLPSDQLAALQSIWLELKRLYGAHSPDKSGMIQQAITDWLRRWDGPDRAKLLQDLLEIRQDTRRRQYRK